MKKFIAIGIAIFNDHVISYFFKICFQALFLSFTVNRKRGLPENFSSPQKFRNSQIDVHFNWDYFVNYAPRDFLRI